jgi:hypothetical protein
MQAALVEIGAIYVSANVHPGWGVAPVKGRFKGYAGLPVIPFGSNSKVSGGHAFAFVGYTDVGFVVQNSWGRDWGLTGFAIMTYADWVANGTDAWTVSLGVPIVPQKGGNALRSPRAFSVTSGGLNATLAGASGALPSPPTDKPYWMPLDEPAVRERVVVMGNNGMPISRLVECANATDAVARVTQQNALSYFANHPAGKLGSVKRVMLYAHGGLNSEEDSMVRARILTPYFEENGVYPIFITWKSGAGEIIKDMLQDHANSAGSELPLAGGMLDKIKEAAMDVWDRAIEILAQNLGVKSVWSEMKQNAMLGAQSGNALALIATELVALRKAVVQQGGTLEVHLVGHSAGSIVLGHMLDLFATSASKQPLASCSLFAPACTVAFANAHYVPAVSAAKILKKQSFHIDVLSEDREMDDAVGPYRKSLLHLVSRALEDLHKMPILGLLKAFDSDCNHDEHWNEPRLAQLVSELTQWQDFWWAGAAAPKGFYRTGHGAVGTNLGVVNAGQVDTGARRIHAAHGSFDNDIAVVKATMARILGTGVPTLPAPNKWNLDYN